MHKIGFCRVLDLRLDYHQGIPLENLAFLISIILLVVIVSRYLFKIKLENNLFSEDQLTEKPLYVQRDLLLQEKPLEFHREQTIDEIPVLKQPSLLTRVVILLAIVSFFVIPLTTIWMRNFN